MYRFIRQSQSSLQKTKFFWENEPGLGFWYLDPGWDQANKKAARSIIIVIVIVMFCCVRDAPKWTRFSPLVIPPCIVPFTTFPPSPTCQGG